MSNRNLSENSDSISLFPFLAVLLCTMGALLVLLVVLVHAPPRRGCWPRCVELTLASSYRAHARQSGARAATRRGTRRNRCLRSSNLQKLRPPKPNRGCNRSSCGLSHSEEHARRLEEELAKLAIANAQLQHAEANETVDQQQAESEAARLEKLIADTQQHVEELRAESGGKHSYAIVPYKGPNGTYRKPLYIECNSEGSHSPARRNPTHRPRLHRPQLARESLGSRFAGLARVSSTAKPPSKANTARRIRIR